MVVLGKNAECFIVNVLKQGCGLGDEGQAEPSWLGGAEARRRGCGPGLRPPRHSGVQLLLTRFLEVPIPNLLQFLILPGIQYRSHIRIGPRMHSLELLQFLNA